MAEMQNGIQQLVNAQVEVNRAVFMANDKHNGNRLKLTNQQRNRSLVVHAKEAVNELQQFINEMDEQPELFRTEPVKITDEGIEILKELCNLKHYKDHMGKDAFYEKQQPLAWKRANDYLNSLVKK